ncbi:MAG: type II secretion system protein GspN, partial [Pseudomonadota bacterium]
MSQAIQMFRSWILYLCYTIILSCVLFYILFPSDLATRYVEQTLTERLGGATLSISRVKLAFPLGIRLLDAIFFFNDPKNIKAFQAEKIDIFPRLLPCLSGRPEFVLSARAYHGTMDGSLRLSGQKLAAFTADIKDLMLNDMEFVQEVSGKRFTGK